MNQCNADRKFCLQAIGANNLNATTILDCESPCSCVLPRPMLRSLYLGSWTRGKLLKQPVLLRWQTSKQWWVPNQMNNEHVNNIRIYDLWRVMKAHLIVNFLKRKHSFWIWHVQLYTVGRYAINFTTGNHFESSNYRINKFPLRSSSESEEERIEMEVEEVEARNNGDRPRWLVSIISAWILCWM